MLRAALHDINPRGVNAGMTEQVCQFRYVLLRPVERDGKQMPEVMGKDLAAVYAGVVAQALQFPPDVGAVQRLSVSGDEHGTGRNPHVLAVGQQFPAQILRDEDFPPLALAVNDRDAAPKGFHGHETKFIGLLFAETM